jgi:hypothetical protein
LDSPSSLVIATFWEESPHEAKVFLRAGKQPPRGSERETERRCRLFVHVRLSWDAILGCNETESERQKYCNDLATNGPLRPNNTWS